MITKCISFSLGPSWSLSTFEKEVCDIFLFNRIRLGLAMIAGQFPVLRNSYAFSTYYLNTDVFPTVHYIIYQNVPQ